MSNVYNGSLLKEVDIVEIVAKACTKRVIIDMDCCNIVVIANPDIVYWDSKGLVGESSKVSKVIGVVVRNCGSIEIIPCKSNECQASTIAQGVSQNFLALSAELSDRLYEDTKRTLLEAMACPGALTGLEDHNFIDNENTQAQVIRRYYGAYCC